MKHEDSVQFKSAQQEIKPLSLIEAIAAAKSTVSLMTSLEVDSVVKCAQHDGGGWVVSIDVVESLARMGDNDLLATYEVHIGQSAELLNYGRLRRYHREDKDA